MRALAATVSHGSPTSCYRVGGQGHLFPLPSRGARALNKRLKSLPFLSPPLLPASSFLPRCIPPWPASLHAFLPWRGLPGAGEKGTLELRLLAWCPAWTACPKGDPGCFRGLGQGDLSVASLHPVRVWFSNGCLGGEAAPSAPPHCILAAHSSNLCDFPQDFTKI